MSTSNVWQTVVSGSATNRTMTEMLYDAVGDIGTATSNRMDFYIDVLGMSQKRAVTHLRYNVYIRVIKTGYVHLFFQVETRKDSHWPAVVSTPEDTTPESVNNEPELKNAIQKIIERPWTSEVVQTLLKASPS